MAIDTKAKRASVQAYTLGLMRPPPDGVIADGDRACVAWLYSGIDYAAPTVSEVIMNHLRALLAHLATTYRHMRETLRHYRRKLWHRGGSD